MISLGLSGAAVLVLLPLPLPLPSSPPSLLSTISLLPWAAVFARVAPPASLCSRSLFIRHPGVARTEATGRRQPHLAPLGSCSTPCAPRLTCARARRFRTYQKGEKNGGAGGVVTRLYECLYDLVDGGVAVHDGIERRTDDNNRGGERHLIAKQTQTSPISSLGRRACTRRRHTHTHTHTHRNPNLLQAKPQLLTRGIMSWRSQLTKNMAQLTIRCCNTGATSSGTR